MKNCLQPYEMARNKFREHVFIVGGTVWNNRDFTPPPSKKNFRIEIVHHKIHEIICICIKISIIIPYNQWQCQSRVQKLFQERVPGGLPGTRSWRSPRNAFLQVIQERDFWKMKNCLQPYERARNKFWEKVFIVGGTVWNNRDFTPPPSKKILE